MDDGHVIGPTFLYAAAVKTFTAWCGYFNQNCGAAVRPLHLKVPVTPLRYWLKIAETLRLQQSSQQHDRYRFHSPSLLMAYTSTAFLPPPSSLKLRARRHSAFECST